MQTSTAPSRPASSTSSTRTSLRIVEGQSLREWLAQALGGAEFADRLAALCRRVEFQPGDVIARQGDDGELDALHPQGRIGIMVAVDEARTVRVRSLGRHTTVGELGLVTQRPRNATIQAESAGILYELGADAFAQIKERYPALAQALLSYVVTLTAERLAFANRLIGVLQR